MKRGTGSLSLGRFRRCAVNYLWLSLNSLERGDMGPSDPLVIFTASEQIQIKGTHIMEIFRKISREWFLALWFRRPRLDLLPITRKGAKNWLLAGSAAASLA